MTDIFAKVWLHFLNSTKSHDFFTNYCNIVNCEKKNLFQKRLSFCISLNVIIEETVYHLILIICHNMTMLNDSKSFLYSNKDQKCVHNLCIDRVFPGKSDHFYREKIKPWKAVCVFSLFSFMIDCFQNWTIIHFNLKIKCNE